MIERTAIVRNEYGIHCRPSAVIVKTAYACPCQVQALADSGAADLRSLMSVLALGLAPGAAVRIQASGPDEDSWCQRFVELFETHFDFPPLPPGDRAALLSQAP